VSELARCNGTVVVQDRENVGIVAVGGGWIGTAIFVAGLVGGIAVVAGTTVAVTVQMVPGAVVVGIGAIAIAATVMLVRARRRMRSAGLPRPWLVLDRTARVVRSSTGAELCTFDAVRLERVFQAASSAKALAMHCPNKVVIARGTPFGDSVDAVEAALRRALA
jgi:hypothetical protein